MMLNTRSRYRTAIPAIFVSLAFSCLLLGSAAPSATATPHHCSAFTASHGESVLFASNQDHVTLEHAINPTVWFYPALAEGDFGYVLFGVVWQEYGATHTSYGSGINEGGLAYANAALPVVPLAPQSGKKITGWSIFHARAMRECADVSCVVELANTVNWGRDSRNLQQWLFADATGDAVAFSADKDGELAFTRIVDDPYLAITNFNLANPENSVTPLPCARYEAIGEMLTDVDAPTAVTVPRFRSILETIRAAGLHGNTAYSHVFDLNTGDVFVYYFHQFKDGVRFNVSQELTKGPRAVKLAELVPESVRERVESESQVYFALQPQVTLIQWAVRVLLILDILGVIAAVVWVSARLRRRRKEKVPSDTPGHSELSWGILFLLVTLAWTWTFLMIPTLHSLGWSDSNVALTKPPLTKTLSVTLAGLGPIIAAFALTWLSRGKREFVSLGLNPRLGTTWWVMILLIYPVLFTLAYLVAGLFQPAVRLERLQTGPTLIFLGFAIIGEFGWRGYALGRLQSRLSALVSSLIIGLAWSLWHLPLFFTVGTPQAVWSFPYFAILAMLASVLLGWIYNSVGESVIAAFALQAMFTFLVYLGGLGGLLRTDWGAVSVIAVTAVAVVVVTFYWGPSQLVRKAQERSW